MIHPELATFSVLGAVTMGLAYYRWVFQPSLREARLQGAVRAFGAAIELRFPSHAGLTESVSQLANRVGRRLGFGPRRLRRLERAVRLRDIGLCAVPYRLVNQKKWDDWTLSETATYDCHAEIGGAILETVPALSDLAEIVRKHHAPYVTEAPPLEARIAKACAEYVWYRRHRGEEAARLHLEMGRGTLFDPLVATAVVELAEPAPPVEHNAAVYG